METERVNRRRIGLVLATSTGGVGQHVRSLALHLGQAGNHVVVCGAQAAEELFSFTAVGAEFRPVEIGVGIKPLADIRAILALRQAIADVDVVHAHGYRAGLIASLARRQWQPLVVTWHNMLMAEGIERVVLGQLERVVARRADITLGASQDLVERALRLGAADARFSPVAAPPLPAPTQSADEVRSRLGAQDRPLIVAIGRLHPQKAFDVLLHAATRWKKRTPVPQVVVAGSGPQQKELETLAKRLDVPVVFLGHRTDIAELLSASDVAVVTSVWEARQLVAQETLRAGKPLVATAVGGIPELVGDGARLVPVGDPDAVAKAVNDLLDDPVSARELGEKGAKRSMEWPTEGQTAEAVLAVYVELLGELSCVG